MPARSEPARGRQLAPAVPRRAAACDYFTSTVAPWSSSCFLSLAASSLVTPSFTVLPPASTRSLASLRPRPGDGADFLDDVDLLVAAGLQDDGELGLLLDRRQRQRPEPRQRRRRQQPTRPTSLRAAWRAQPPRRTVRLERSSTIFARSAMTVYFLRFEPRLTLQLRHCARRCSWRLASAAACRYAASPCAALRLNDARQLGARLLDGAGDLRRRRVEEADELGSAVRPATAGRRAP